MILYHASDVEVCEPEIRTAESLKCLKFIKCEEISRDEV